MNETVSIALILAATRSVLLIICELAGVLCIYLGWKLYIKAVASTTEGEFSGPGFKLKLASGGPGVFLCGLGIWLLVSIANRPFETTTSEALPSAQTLTPSVPIGNATLRALAQTPMGSVYSATASSPISPAQKKPAEKASPCLVRTVTTRMEVGLSLTTVDVEQAAKTAAMGIKRAGAASIADDEERSVTVRVLDQLASDAAKSHEADSP
jgi:hypothetical protein